MVTRDIQKAFDSVNHSYLVAIVKAFGKKFLHWIEILLTNQESCTLNGETTSKDVRLKKGTRQRDSISAFLLLLLLEIAFVMSKANQNIEPLNISSHAFLYNAYADNTTFFIRNKNSVITLLNVFDIFFVVSGLKPNKSKCEIAGTSKMKGVYVALCGLKCIILMNETVSFFF